VTAGIGAQTSIISNQVAIVRQAGNTLVLRVNGYVASPKWFPPLGSLRLRSKRSAAGPFSRGLPFPIFSAVA
jgi:hypothetical protein